VIIVYIVETDMSLGVCCHWVRRDFAPRTGRPVLVNELEEKSLQLGRWERGLYSEDVVRGVYLHNVRMLQVVLRKVVAAGVKLFRVSSAMFPLSDRVPRGYWDNDAVRRELAVAGGIARGAGVRLTTHPGQFCVLSSDSDAVVAKSIVELEHHAWVLDAMGLPSTPHAAINVHGGKADRVSRLVDVVKSLPVGVRTRLTLENCETCYSLVDLLPVAVATGVPLVWDSHHHVFNDGGLEGEEAASAADETWPQGVKPLQHLSNTEPAFSNGSFTERRKHSDMVHYIPEPQLSRLRRGAVDLEVEAKLKNIAVFDMSKKFNIPL